MLHGRRLCAVVLFLAWMASAGSADLITIDDVPSYIWYYGCGPTAAGMIIGYWDDRGYGGLIPGSSDWNTNQQAVKDTIASPGHIRDYVPTPDRPATAADPYHPDDSVADFSHCSRDPNPYGWSSFAWQQAGLIGYASFRGYIDASAGTHTFLDGTFWLGFAAEIDAGRPVELLVDKDKNGFPDHYVTGIGYDNTPGNERYACFDTYSHSVQWYDFQMPATGRAYGIYGGTFFDPGRVPGDANGDGKVDGGDLAAWQQHYDPLGVHANTFEMGNWNGDNRIDGADLAIWQQNYDPLGSGPVGGDLVTGVSGQGPRSSTTMPEPATLMLLAGGLGGLAAGRRRCSGRRGWQAVAKRRQ